MLKSLFWLLLFTVFSVQAIEPPVVYNYPEMFNYARKLLPRKSVQKFLREVFAEELTISEEQQLIYKMPEKIKDFSESQFVLLLQHNHDFWVILDEYIKAFPEETESNPEMHKEWKKRFKEVLNKNRIIEVFGKLNDPLVPLTLMTQDGSPGYKNVKVYANHSIILKGEKKPASNLVQVWKDFILSAKKQIVLNVFDFDLEEIADALIEQTKKGVSVRVGIDGGTIKTRPEVKAIYDKLSAQTGIMVHAVDSVGLNHQKMAAIDWDTPSKTKVILSSGNLTKSCLHPEGDLAGTGIKSPYSIPNANHVVVMDSWLAGQLVNHEISKTIDPGLRLRGDEYPLGGAYKILGENNAALVLTFSPKGGLGDLNRDVLAKIILETKGPIRMLQFAFSSDILEAALRERAKMELERTGQFIFEFVGDTPFASRDWSVAMSMSGYKTEEWEKTKIFIPDQESLWALLLGPEKLALLQKGIEVAPEYYGVHKVKVNGEMKEVTSKIHHKMIISGEAGSEIAVLGGSYNFSVNANHNQETLPVFIYDPVINEYAHAIFEGLSSESEQPLALYLDLRTKSAMKKFKSLPNECPWWFKRLNP